jgi:hypothetical protein
MRGVDRGVSACHRKAAAFETCQNQDRGPDRKGGVGPPRLHRPQGAGGGGTALIPNRDTEVKKGGGGDEEERGEAAEED